MDNGPKDNPKTGLWDESMEKPTDTSNKLWDEAMAGMKDAPVPAPEEASQPETLKSFYESIKNPLDDDEVVKKIISGYANNNGNLYHGLEEIGTENKKSNSYNPQDKTTFDNKMFERWRKKILETFNVKTDEEAKKTWPEGVVDFKTYRSLAKFIRNHPEYQSADDLMNAINAIDDGETRYKTIDILDKYYWDFDNQKLYYPWKHIKSRNVNAKMERRINVEHRLYLNTELSDVYATVDALADEYEKNDTPYYFKFSCVERADTIVIYTSTDGLIKNLDIVRKVLKDHPDIADRMGPPPILTGVIDGKIGYGSEPTINEGHQMRYSYNSLRAKIIEKAIEETALSWIDKNKDIRLGGGRNIPRIIAVHAAKRVQKYQRELYERNKRNGYEQSVTPSDLEDGSRMLQEIERNVFEHFDEFLEYAHGGEFVHKEVKSSLGKDIEVDGFDTNRAIAALSEPISKISPSFIPEVRQKIAERAAKCGIGSKFVFDTSIAEKMQNQ